MFLSEWQNDQKQGQSGNELVRNLDHIGGGNLLRNLDHIGGGNLLRSLGTEKSRGKIRSESSRNDQSYQLDEKLRPRSGWSVDNKDLDSIEGGNLFRRAFDDVNKIERNLDHIGAGNLLRDLNIDTTNPGVKSSSNYKETEKDTIRRSYQRPSWVRGNLKHIDDENLLGRRAFANSYDMERNLDHIGGGNLLRDLKNLKYDPQQNGKETSTLHYVSSYGNLNELGDGILHDY